jgi:hypothetical protein
LLELFGGSARPLMAHLAEAGKLSLEDLKEMESFLAEQEFAARQGEAGESEAGPAVETSVKKSERRRKG